jgi:hypothetical protein
MTPRAPRKRTSTRRVSVRQLKREFDAAHQAGMASLEQGDYSALAKAIAKERAILEEQADLTADSRRAFKERSAPKWTPPRRNVSALVCEQG